MEIGAGEGRVSRVVGRLGWRMTLVEPLEALRSAAQQDASGKAYIAAPADAVPLVSGAFDLVVLYNVLRDVDDLDGAVSETTWLCAPSGRVIISLVHPILDVAHALEAGQLDPPYFNAHRTAQTIARNGLTMRFASWRRSISDYVNALSRAGLAITRMMEPAPDPNHPKTADLIYGRQLPLFLWLEARPITPGREPTERTGP